MSARRCQFTLRQLLGATVGVAIAANIGLWYWRVRDVGRCEQNFLRLSAMYDVHMLPEPEMVADASLALMRAEQSVPFSNRHAAAMSHARRMDDLEMRVSQRFQFALFGSEEALEHAGKTAAAIRTLCEAAHENARRLQPAAH